jgi:hypothetical protein
MIEDEVLLREGLQVLVETLQGGPARRLPSAGRFSAKIGGPDRLAALFSPTSPDPQAAMAFRERHETGMRAEVLAAVSCFLYRLDNGCTDGECDQTHFDDKFVALANLQLLLRGRRVGQGAAPIAHRLAEICHATQNNLTEDWFQPLISAKLNSPDPPQVP